MLSTTFTLIVGIIILALVPSNALDNGVALTPPMGWMSWERFRCQTDCERYPDACINEALIKRTADKMKSDGWLEAGYEYLIIDDCWMSMKRDNKTKELVADPKRFPSGYEAIAKYIHDKGLKVGIYLDYGTHTCGGYPGSLDYMEVDTKTMAKWKADYIKLDGCYSNHSTQPDGYAEFGRLLNKTGRPMVYSCSYPAYAGWTRNTSIIDWVKLVKNCNLWRMLGDVEDAWWVVKSFIQAYAKFGEVLADAAGPGHWNDPDMLMGGNYGLSKAQLRTQMAMWSMFAAPLLLSTDLDQIDAYSKELMQNKRLIDIDQDSAGHQARLIKATHNLQYWMRPLGFDQDQYAIACIYLSEGGSPVKVGMNLTDFGIFKQGQSVLLDVFSGKEQQLESVKTIFTPSITPHGTAMYRVEPMKR